MSGRKNTTVNVDQSYLRGLQQSESELRRIRNDVPNLLRDLERRQVSDLQQRLAPLEQRQNAFQQSIANLNSSVVNLERDTAKKLAEQQRNMRQELQQQENRLQKDIGKVAQDTKKMIEQQGRRFDETIQQERRVREQQIHQVATAIEQEARVRQQQHQQVTDAIDQEARARQKQGKQLADAINQEADIRQQQIEQESRARQQQGEYLANAINEEAQARQRQGEQLAGAITEEAQARLRQGEQLVEALDHEAQLRNNQINQVRSDIQATEDYKREVARTWVESAETIRDFIEKNYRHQQFAPGRLAEQQRKIQQAQQNIEQNLAESAIGQAQEAYQQLSDLRLQLERLEQEWEMWLNSALTSSRELFELARENRTCQALDMENGELKVQKDDTGKEVEVEVDYWADGKLSTLEKELEEQIKLLEENKDITTENLQQIAGQANPDFNKRLEQIIYEARLAIISSQLRFSISDIVIEKLSEQGFELDDETYEGEDMRTGYVTKVRNLKGDEIVIRVVPKAENPTENDLQIHSYDKDQRGEEELRQRAKELNESLRESGLQAGEAQEIAGGQPDPVWQNVEVVRKMKPVQQRKVA